MVVKPGKYKLLRTHAVVPENTRWLAQHLGPGSVVEVLEPRVSPITGTTHELTVRWRDVAGRITVGWLEEHAVLKPLAHSVEVCYVVADRNDPPSIWDRMRTVMASWRQTRLALPMVRSWLSTEGTVRAVAELQSVVREFGGRSKTDDVKTLCRDILRLTTHNAEAKMSTKTEQHTDEQEQDTVVSKRAKKHGKSHKNSKNGKSAKKAKHAESSEKTVKTEVEKGADLTSAQRCGQRVLDALRAAKAENGVQLAKKAASGKTLSHAQWTELRDSIHEAARDTKKASLATELRHSVRVVRRFVRNTAK